jgi:uncharacterized protein YdbL (DUF1318 family)
VKLSKDQFSTTPLSGKLGAAALAVLCVLAGAGAPALLAAPAVAQSAGVQSAGAKAEVDQAKAQGVVGEQADGFLGLVSGGDPSVRAAMAEINAGRAQAYRDAAARSGVSPETAGQATARQLAARLGPGEYFRTADGRWERH